MDGWILVSKGSAFTGRKRLALKGNRNTACSLMVMGDFCELLLQARWSRQHERLSRRDKGLLWENKAIFFSLLSPNRSFPVLTELLPSQRNQKWFGVLFYTDNVSSVAEYKNKFRMTCSCCQTFTPTCWMSVFSSLQCSGESPSLCHVTFTVDCTQISHHKCPHGRKLCREQQNH